MIFRMSGQIDPMRMRGRISQTVTFLSFLLNTECKRPDFKPTENKIPSNFSRL